MANKIWVLAADDSENYQCVIHTPTPVGNNSANVPWATCLVAAGLATTILPDGGASPASYQQSTTEKNNVLNGSIIEIVKTLPIAGANANAAQVAALRDQIATDIVAHLGRVLKWYGYSE